jgi:putative ABC transport system permease protein
VAWYLAHYKVYYALGRLRAGVRATQAPTELARLIPELERGSPFGPPLDAVVTPVDDYLVGPAKPVLWMMLAGALLMVLLACSSVSGLHLFRSARQDRAIAIHLALGASRGRLVRRALVESGALTMAGGVAAIAVAWLVTRALVLAAPQDVPRLNDASLGTPAVLILMLGLVALASLVSGAWPALFITHVDPGRTLTSGARAAMHPRERFVQRVVVGWQVAVAVMLLSAAALFVRSVQQLGRTPLGFVADNLVAVSVEPSMPDQDRWDAFHDALLARLERLPHVRSAGAVSLRPLSGPIGNDTIPVPKAQAGLGPDAPWRRNARGNLETVTPGYFGAMGTHVLHGRDFAPADRATAPNVVIVSESAAASYWPGRNPIGEPVLVATQRLPGSLEDPRWQTVVGVVEDVRYRGLTMPRLDIYLPAAQSTVRVKDLLVRTTGTAAQVASDVRAIAQELDRAVLIGEVVTMNEVIARESAPWRFAMRVLSAFGALAAVLATVGLVGLVSLAVTLRRRELGIRATLGATPQRLRRQVMADAAWTALGATFVGVLGALVIGRLAASLLVDTAPHDPVSIGGSAMVTLIAGVVASFLPTRRAVSANPVDVLRD